MLIEWDCLWTAVINRPVCAFSTLFNDDFGSSDYTAPSKDLISTWPNLMQYAGIFPGGIEVNHENTQDSWFSNPNLNPGRTEKNTNANHSTTTLVPTAIIFVPKIIYKNLDRWKNTNRGELNNSYINLSQCHLVHHKSNTCCSELQLVPSRWEAGD
jgi:hypothetical protein